MNEYTVGIDLGTTNSCVAIYKNNSTVEIIENEQGHRVTPSWVTFTEDVVLTGDEAVNESHKYLKTTVYEAKRLIGQKFDDPKVQQDIEGFPYTVVDDLGSPKIEIKSEDGGVSEYYPEEISAFILRHLKNIAEKRLSATITRAVVTVPAYFNDAQRQATKDAATIAGFTTVNVINEPTAAALAFHHNNTRQYRRNIVVYDFGGGTFDVSVVTVGRGKCEVKATKGDSHLGGTDIDTNLVNYIKQHFKQTFKNDITESDVTKRRLKRTCEKAKKKLSGSQLQTTVELDFLSGTEEYCVNLSRARLEQLNQGLFDRTLQIVDECLQDSGIKKDDIDEAVLVGGSSRIPKIQTMLQEYFGKDKINKGINPDEAVAYGAAIHASNLAGDKNEVYDVTSLSLGTNTYGDLMSVIIPRNTPIPARSVKRYQTIMDNQTTMEFPIYQGEKEIASENFELGNFTMADLTEAPAKSVKVEICFQMDGEGLLHVSAIETNSDNKKNITIDVQKKGLTQEQIQERILDAERNQEKENTRRKFTNERYTLEVLLGDAKACSEKCSVELRDNILDKFDEISKWMDKAKIDDLDEFPSKKQELEHLIAQNKEGR